MLRPDKIARAAGTGASVPIECCQVCGSDGHQPPAAQDHCLGGEHAPDRAQGVLGLALLHEPDGGVDQHDAQD
ncbi:MAG: hypothetical protein P8Y53_25535, partial [Pseudolabrys sp.]